MARKEDTDRPEGAALSSPVGGISSGVMGMSGGGLATVPSGGIARGMMPAGLFSNTLALEADVSGELAAMAPTFGDVLMAMGNGIATAQEALDRGLVETARQLSATRITVVSEVVQELNDDGLPNPAATQLVSTDVSLINYVNPIAHEWKHVALSMDMSVGAMDSERGMSFSQSSRSSGTHAYGLLWGTLGWFDMESSRSSSSGERRTDYEADWASGQVRMDAMLGPRRTDRFSAPAEVSVGPQLYFSLGSVIETANAEGDVTARAIDVIIKARKANGAVNPSVNIEVDPAHYGISFASTGGFSGSTTNAQGEVKITLTRNISSPRFLASTRGRVTVNLGQIKKYLEISL